MSELPEQAACSPWRLSVAPMMAWTDKHCRYFHRLITQKAVLYTEMVSTGALLHGDVRQHLRFDAAEHPVALQLGGSEPAELARAARIGQDWGYDEINLNCGCPSVRVQRGAFGACLMAEPELVADGVKAMLDAVSIPVSVKHRVGIDRIESYDFVRDFVGRVSEVGCNVFIVHARNAWLDGLSPKENREVPPLRHELAYRLKRDFPWLTLCINGGISTNAQIAEHLRHMDGVMIGREAYHNPWLMADWDAAFFPQAALAESLEAPERTPLTRDSVEEQMVAYMEQEFDEDGTPWSAIARHMLGLRHGLRGARRWRQIWSDHHLKTLPAREVWAMAREFASKEA